MPWTVDPVALLDSASIGRWTHSQWLYWTHWLLRFWNPAVPFNPEAPFALDQIVPLGLQNVTVVAPYSNPVIQLNPFSNWNQWSHHEHTRYHWAFIKSLASEQSRDITFAALVPWYQILTLTLLTITPNNALTLTGTRSWTLTQPRNEYFSRLAEHWPQKNQFFAHNSSGLHFYPTSCGVIRNQRRKIRPTQSSNIQNTQIKGFLRIPWRVN